MKYVWFFVISCFVSFFTTAQEQKDVLITINKEAVLEDEFVRVYKKNLNLIEDETQKDLDTYLQSFIDFKLKILEAKKKNYHKKKNYINEFNGYKKALLKKYSTATTISEELIQEAYKHLKTEINASHILVRLPHDASPSDTLIAYNKSLKIRENTLKVGFENLGGQIHDGKTVIAEQLGYFSTLRMHYLFEKEAYTLKKGEVSKPIRTPFGYHIIKINDKRKNRGKVTIAHILIENKEDIVQSKQKIQKIYSKTQQGTSFETLALYYSDDRESAVKGGRLPEFVSSELMGTSIEEMAFSLSAGAISKPFQSKFGWHIIKVLKKETIGNYQEERSQLITRIKRDDRSRPTSFYFLDELKERYKFKELGEISKVVNNYGRAIEKIRNSLLNTIIFKIDTTSFKGKDFIKYLKQQQIINSNLSLKEYDNFIEHIILKYHEDYLEKTNKDYINILSEYRDGLLLFDIMGDKVWNKSRNDTLAIQLYYKKNRTNYIWNKKVSAMIFVASDKNTAQHIKSFLSNNTDPTFIRRKIKNKFKEEIIPIEQIFEISDRRLPFNYIAELGISDIFLIKGAHIIIKTIQIIDESYKTLKEANNEVVSDFQKFLEEEWLTSLRIENEININEKTFNKVKTRLLK